MGQRVHGRGSDTTRLGDGLSHPRRAVLFSQLLSHIRDESETILCVLHRLAAQHCQQPRIDLAGFAHPRRVLPVELQRDSSTAPGTAAATLPALTLAEAERRHILGTLAAALGNRARAAQMLGIGQATLFRKLKQYGAAARRARKAQKAD